MFRVEETLFVVQLVTEGVAPRVVGLLPVASAISQQAFAVLIDEGIMCHAHLIGRGIVVDLAARLAPLVLEHHRVFEEFQELRLEVYERTQTDVAALGEALVERLQDIEAEGHQLFAPRGLHGTDLREVGGAAGIAAHVHIGRIDQVALLVDDAGITLLHVIVHIRVVGLCGIREAAVDTQFGGEPFRELEAALHIE